MESTINPNMIQNRAEAVAAAADKPAETTPAVTTEVQPEVTGEVKPEIKVEAKPEVKAEIKPEVKVEPKQPNDPIELRKWATKASQENAALREEMRGIKAALDKMMKKPVDYKELAKNPESIKAQIEAERQEVMAEMQDKLQEATTKATAQETTVERIRREQDAVNYPEWKRVFSTIQSLAANTDGRINFNKKPGEVLDDLYALALQIAPAAPPAPVVAPKPEAAVQTPEEHAAEIAAVKKQAFEEAQAALRAERNGAGIGQSGKGGRRDGATSKEALQNMPLKDLKKLISRE